MLIYKENSPPVTVKRLIEQRIVTIKAELVRLESLLPKVGDQSACQICPNCKTENYNYDVRFNRWTCAYCG